MTASDLRSAALDLYRQGSFTEAAAGFERARAAYEAEGDRAMAAEMQSNLGVARRALKDFDPAVAALEAAIAEFRALNDSHRQGLALGNLGSILLETGDLARAADSLSESISLLDAVADKQARSEAMRVLGEVRLKQGKYMEGMLEYEAGLREVDNPSGQQKWLQKLLAKPLKMLGLKK